jgi:WD40 repeat protein
VAFSLDGRQVLSGGGDLKLWDAASGALLRTFMGHSDYVMAVAFSPDGQKGAVGLRGRDASSAPERQKDGSAPRREGCNSGASPS